MTRLETIGFSVLLSASAAAHAAQSVECGTHGVAVQVLGSGGPELQDKRASSSYLVWRDAKPRVLVDIGGGAALRFGESGADVSDLDVILLTHLHVDHTADLAALVKSSFFEDRQRKLPLYGPEGNQAFPATTAFVHTLFAAPGGAYHYLNDFVNPSAKGAYLLDAHDVAPPAKQLVRIYQSQDTYIYAAQVIHGSVPALAYRVEIAGVSIAFSGDTNGNNGNLQRVAHGADLFIAHNAVRDGASAVELSLHMPPSVIGKVAHEAAVKNLVLSHRMLRTLGHEVETTTGIRGSYSGPVSFANDLDCFAVTH